MNIIGILIKGTLFFFFTFYVIAVQAQLNWSAFPGPEGGSSHYFLLDNGVYAFYPDPNALYRSEDGENWLALPLGNIKAMATNGPALVGIQYQDYEKPLLWFSQNHGESWQQGVFPVEDSGLSANIALSDDGIFISHNPSKRIFRSVNGGLNWDAISRPASLQSGFIKCFSSRSRVYAAQGKFLFRLATGAQGWDSIPLPADFFGVSAFFEDSDVMVVGSDFGALWSSRDAGQSWTRFYDDEYEARSFARLGNALFASKASRLYHSSDLGLTWTQLPLPYKDNFAQMALVADRLLLQSSTIGVLRYDPATGQLESANTGLFSARVAHVDISGNDVWAACPDGLYRADLEQKEWTFHGIKRPFSMVKANANGGVAALTAFRDTLYLSLDEGLTWKKTALRDIVANFSSSSFTNIEWAGTRIFLNSTATYRSDDGGLSWQSSANVTDRVFFKGNWYAHNGTQILKSTDGALSWQPIFTLGTDPFAYMYSLSAAGDYLFAWFYEDVWRTAMHYSEDGVTWNYADEGLNDVPFRDSQFEFYVDNGGVWEHKGIYYAQHPLMYLYMSPDTLKHWYPIAHVRQQMQVRDSMMYSSSPYEGGGVLVAPLPSTLLSAFAQGTVYVDENNNSLFDSGERVLTGQTLAVKSPNSLIPYWTGTSDTQGRYSILSNGGQADTLMLQFDMPYPFEVNPPFYLMSNTTAQRDFGVYFPEKIEDLAASGNYLHRPVPGFPFTLIVGAKNRGTAASSGRLGVKLSPEFQFNEASVPPIEVFPDSLVWDIAALEVLGEESIRLKGTLDANAVPGNLLRMGVSVHPDVTDAHLDNNYFLLRDTIVAAYDPNEKRVQPTAGLSAAEIEAGIPLVYTIHFQNIGTFPATRVRITDQLDPELESESLQLLGASHTVNAFRLLPGGNLEIVFEDIVLPDSSSDEAGSHGFLQFSIQRKKAFDPFALIRNSANIYFDFNAPILTNTVWTPLRNVATGLNAPVSADRIQALHLSPNPSDALVQINTEGLMGQGRIQVADFYGKTWLEMPVLELDKPFMLDLSALPAGAYGVQLFNARHRRQGKLILMR